MHALELIENIENRCVFEFEEITDDDRWRTYSSGIIAEVVQRESLNLVRTRALAARQKVAVVLPLAEQPVDEEGLAHVT